jgi:hypothetical protein
MHSLLEDYLAEVAAHLSALPTKRHDEELREVQAHLESAVAAMREGGASEAEAVGAVLEQFGQAKVVARGFVAAWRRGENKRKGIVMKERIFFGASLAMVTLGSAWLMFVAAMISHTLFPKGQILIHASEGASLKVQQGVVQVLSAGSNGTGVEHFNGALLTAFVSVPFALLVGFALVGCCSLLRPRRIAR